MSKNKKINEKTHEEKCNEQSSEISNNLKEKKYLITAYQTGDVLMSNGDYNKMIHGKRFYAVVSLNEIPDYIKGMQQPFWVHPSLTNETQKNRKFVKTIPYEEKKWGIYRDIVIEPLSEELEESYLDGVKKGFFKTWRKMSAKGYV